MTDDDIAAEAILPASTLESFLETLTPLVSEARLHFKSGDLIASVIDSAGVAMIRPCRLDADACESYRADDVTIGVNLDALTERLGPANAGDLVHVQLDMATRHLRIEYRGVSHTIAMIDPDAIRSEPDDPSLDLPNTVTLLGSQIDEVVTHTDMVSDHVVLETDPDAGEVTWRARGDTDDTTITYDGDTVVSAHVPEATESMFSIAFLDELSDPMPDDAEVQIHFGDDHPMTLDWIAEDGHLDVHQMVAPRIDTTA